MAQRQEVRFGIGDRVQVFHAKDRMWRPGSITETNKTGANVRLDSGYVGFFYWASMSPVVKPKTTEPTASTVGLDTKNIPALPALEREFFSTGVEAAYPGVRVRLVQLTPEMASELIARNEKNRNIKPLNLARMKRALVGGSWKFNGDTVCLSRSGRLIDGQHRCQMVIDTGVAITVVLVEGLDDDVFDTKDIGARRKASDVLHILGATNCTTLASALGYVDKYFSGKMDSSEGVSTFAIDDLLDEHRDLIDSVRAVANNGLVTPGLLAAMHYLFSLDSREEADRFLRDLKAGAGLADNDGVYVLRERLMKNRSAKAKLPTVEIAALVIKAWNSRRRGTPVHTLRWRTEGENAEAFPIIYGKLRQVREAG